jgi:hypothetical protein
MVLTRIYKIPENINFNSNQLFELNIYDLKQFKQLKLIEKYTVNKKRYLSIFQDNIKDIKTTYTEDFNIIKQDNTDLFLEYKKNILEQEQFPCLNKYDFEETYEEELYEIFYNNKKARFIKNKYESYIELI